MSEEKKYPYIGKRLNDVILFSSEGFGICLDVDYPAGWYGGYREEVFKYVTHDYLKNTWGIVESEEHRSMIRELAVNGGYDNCDESKDKYFCFTSCSLLFFPRSSSCNNEGEKQITLPMPPADKAKHNFTNGQEVFIAQINTLAGIASKRYFVQLYWCDSGHQREYVDLGIIFDNKVDAENKCRDMLGLPPLPETKTPEEELADEIQKTIVDSYLAEDSKTIAASLIAKYNITRKYK